MTVREQMNAIAVKNGDAVTLTCNCCEQELRCVIVHDCGESISFGYLKYETVHYIHIREDATEWKVTQ